MEYTTKSEFPNEYRAEKGRGVSLDSIRTRVAWELRQMRRAYYHNDYRTFAQIHRRIEGYFIIDLISLDTLRRAHTMAYKRGLLGI